jgi:DNA-binding GntR family transcriptional regulator
MTSFSEIEPRSLSDRVVDALKDAFLSGELKPGDPLVERELARQMRLEPLSFAKR